MRRCPGIHRFGDLGLLLGFNLGAKFSEFLTVLLVFRLSRLCVKETVRRAWYFTAKMAQNNWQKLKNRWNAETKDEEKLAAHLRLLRAVGLFAGSVFLMRNFGDLMAI